MVLLSVTRGKVSEAAVATGVPLILMSPFFCSPFPAIESGLLVRTPCACDDWEGCTKTDAAVAV